MQLRGCGSSKKRKKFEILIVIFRQKFEIVKYRRLTYHFYASYGLENYVAKLPNLS